MYFFADSEAGRDALPADVAIALKDEEVRGIALRSAGLSERSLKAIRDMVESARTVEGVDTGRKPRRRPHGDPN
jgi:hypothetical protein